MAKQNAVATKSVKFLAGLGLSVTDVVRARNGEFVATVSNSYHDVKARCGESLGRVAGRGFVKGVRRRVYNVGDKGQLMMEVNEKQPRGQRVVTVALAMH